MVQITESKLEKEVGGHTERVRLVNDILEGGVEHRADEGDEWHFGPLTVGSHPGDDDHIVARTPDGDIIEIDAQPDMEEPLRSLAVEENLRGAWQNWLDSL